MNLKTKTVTDTIPERNICTRLLSEDDMLKVAKNMEDVTNSNYQFLKDVIDNTPNPDIDKYGDMVFKYISSYIRLTRPKEKAEEILDAIREVFEKGDK